MREQQPRTEPPSAWTWGALARDPAAHAVVALGFTQIIAWGTTLYVLGVLGRPIAAEAKYATPHAALSTTGWAR